MTGHRARPALAAALAALCLAAAPAAAQQSPYVALSAPSSQVAAGDHLQLTAVVLDAADRVLAGESVTFTSSNTTRATVDATGTVTGLDLGNVRITASSRAGTRQAQIQLWVVPASLEILPAKAELYVGDQLRLSVRARNRAGAPLGSAFPRWSILEGWSLAGIGGDGALSAFSTGVVTVRAQLVDLAPPFGGGGPFADAQVRIRPRRDYAVTRLLSTEDAGHSFSLREIDSEIAANTAGQVVFQANLDGVASAVLAYRNGGLERVHDASERLPLPGGGWHGYNGSPTIDEAGRVLVTDQGGVFEAEGGGFTPVVLSGIAVGDAQNLRICCGTPRRNRAGDLVFQAAFWYTGLPDISYTGLFRVRGGRPELLYSSDRPLPDDSEFHAGRFAIDAAGAVLVQTNDARNENQALYRFAATIQAADAAGGAAVAASGPDRLVGAGDTYGTTRVSGLGGFAVDADGRLAYALYLADGTSRIVLQQPGGQVLATAAENLGVLDVGAAGVLFTGGSGAAWGLHVWDGTSVRPLLLGGALAPNGEPVRNIHQAFLTSGGDAIVRATLAETGTAVLRVGREPALLFAVGQRVNVTSGPALLPGSLVRGPGEPHLLLGNPSQSLFAVTPSGLVPRLVSGDVLPGGETLNSIHGAVHGAGALFLYTNQNNLYKLTGDGAVLLTPATSGVRIGGGSIAVNARGAVVTVGWRDDQAHKILLYEGGAWRELATLATQGVVGSPSPTGGTFEWVRGLAIDDSGRVMAAIDVRNGETAEPGLFLYEAGAWRSPALPGTVDLWGHESVVFDGGRFLAAFTERNACTGFVAEYREGNAWSVAIPAEARMPIGDREVCSYGRMDASAGAMLLTAHTGTDTLIVHTGGAFRLVASGFEPVAEGDVFLSASDVAFTGRGTVVFLAALASGHTALYEARQLQPGEAGPPPPAPGPRDEHEVDTISLQAPRRWVHAGASLDLVATARNAAGLPLDTALTWTSSSPKTLAVTGDGRVTGLRPGPAIVTARSGLVSAQLRLDVQPLRIEITPGAAELVAGAQAAFTARALDAHGKEIPGQTFTFTSSSPAVASITPAGLLSATGAGAASVTAWMKTRGGGLGQTARAAVRVRPVPDYTESRVLAGDTVDLRPTVRRVEWVEAAGEGRWAVLELLGNGTRQVRVVDTVTSRMLVASGGVFEGSVVESLGQMRANLRGDVLVFFNTLDSGSRLALFPASGAAPQRIALPAPYHGWVNEMSLNEAGGMAFTAGRDNGSDLVVRGLDGALTRILGDGQELPGFGRVDWIGSVRLLDNGSVAFQVNSADRHAIYLWTSGALVRICGSGDTGFLDAPLGWCALPSGRIAATSDVIVGAGAPNNGGAIFRMTSSGGRSTVLASGQIVSGSFEIQNMSSPMAVHGSRVAVGVGTDRGGLFGVVDGTRFDAVSRNGERPEEWRWTNGAALSAGTIAFFGVGGTGRSQLLQVAPRESLLAYSGQVLSGEVPTSFEWRPMAGIGRSRDALFFAGGREVVGRLQGAAFVPLLGAGDTLPEGRTWLSTHGIDIARDGSVALSVNTEPGPAIYRWRQGTYTVLAEVQRLSGPGGAVIHNTCCGQLAGNAMGEVLSRASWNDQTTGNHNGYLLFRDASPTAELVLEDLAPLPGGGRANGVWQTALDESGRAGLVAGNADGGWALVTWERGGRLTTVARSDEPGPQGMPLRAVNRLVAAGQSLYALLQYGDWGSSGQQPTHAIVEITAGGARRTVATGFLHGDILSANTRGDVLYGRSEPQQNALAVARRDGTHRTVLDLSARSASGLWWQSLLGAVLTDEGDVWFSGYSQEMTGNRLGLFRATALR